MTVQTTFAVAQANFDQLWDTVTKNREIVVIQRPGAEDVALIAADELESLMEVAHLLRSPKNAERLLTALQRAQKGIETAQAIDELRREVGVEQEKE
jgi:antitoxin YefM